MSEEEPETLVQEPQACEEEKESVVKEQTEREIAESVIERLIVLTPIENDSMSIYRNGVYISGNKARNRIKQEIKEVVRDFDDYILTTARQHIIIDFIRSLSYCFLDDFDSDGRIISLRNGLYYLDGYKGVLPNPRTEDGHYDTKEDTEIILGVKYFMSHEEYIKQHGEPYKTFVQIPVNYNADAVCNEIDKIVMDVFDKGTVSLIYEMFGCFVLPTVKYGKAFMFYGQTGTGKTSVINIITQFIGFENTAGVELQYLDTKFEIEKTRNKMLNIFDDLSSQPIEFVGNFKKLVTNTWLYGRIKHVQDEVRWKNKCKGLFACNVLPRIKKYVTEAFYKRWVLIPCFNEFKELGSEDGDIREKRYSEEELSGLLNRALEGIRRLEERRNFPEEWQDIEFVKNYWNMDINPLGLFISECCDISDAKAEIDYDVFFRELNRFRREHQVKKISKTMMTKSLKKIKSNIEVKKVFKKSNAIRRFPSGHKYVGIKFKAGYNAEGINIDNLLMDGFLEKDGDLINIENHKV